MLYYCATPLTTDCMYPAVALFHRRLYLAAYVTVVSRTLQ